MGAPPSTFLKGFPHHRELKIREITQTAVQHFGRGTACLRHQTTCLE
jgi:hypothetical protein